MKRILPLLLLCTACASTGGEASWLFVQNAESVELEGERLTLRGVDPVVLCFTDRPQRRTGTVPTGRFLGGWETGGTFEGDPPNATLAVFGPRGIDEAVVVLRNPRLVGRNVTYDVDILEGSSGLRGPAALFIDSVGSGTPVVRHGMHDEPGVVTRRGMHHVR